MTEKIIPLHPRQEPSETPDARHLRADNLRPVRLGDELPADLVDGDLLASMGLDASSWAYVGLAPARARLSELRRLRASLRAALGYLDAVLGDDDGGDAA